MRALLFALAALSLFAVMNAYTNDMINFIEEFPSEFEINNATALPDVMCLADCKRNWGPKPCHCACKSLKWPNSYKGLCRAICPCEGISNPTCIHYCSL